MPTLAETIEWSDHPVASSLAYGTVDVRIGTVGHGGPVGLVVASVHGDEGPWGTLAVNRLLASVRREELLGTLRVVPVAHPLATEADARQTHLDLLDLNSSFPGDPGGSHTQRLAAVLAEHAVDGADVVLDVHGGGSWNINCFTYRFPGSEHVAEWMGTPLILDGPDRASSLTGHARVRGAVAVWIEMGGRGEYEEDRAATVTRGLRRALGKAGVLTEADLPDEPGTPATGKLPLSTSRPGIYRPVLRESALGTVVEQGTVVGHLLDPVSNEVLETFRAPFPRTALALLRPTLARIESPGQVVALVAEIV
ncbi:succinylglutamate desuccinylase/aspartoacylase family protein [Actinokineospora enzanensis]|uniref:succinylglutamate desuccinylase/aspartoacylase family protein n=1 Tax=Actinokineospora enzanensis TaxID=155975 RepID=UPI0003624580|nr:M14 family metallopeptidase [Actinokineospora enzanensis]